MNMLMHLSILWVGFTIFSAVSLFIAYVFFLNDLQKSGLSKLACGLLLFGLSSLQWCHYLALSSSFSAMDSRFYLTCLMWVPASFFYFSRFVLFTESRPQWIDLWHLLPTLLSVFMPKAIIPGMAFMIGSAYCLWFIHLVLKWRTQKNRFFLERFFFALFAFFAMVALVLGLMLPMIDDKLFIMVYAHLIGLAMLLVTTALIVFPDMINDLQQVVEMAYAKSSLNGVDINAKKDQLDRLMQQKSVYQDEKLSLASMADLLDIRPHQLSELVNTQFGHGFSYFVRARRIEHAKKLLVEEPDASILSISILSGFQSQSNFYAAFREFTSQSPGHYRKMALKTSNIPDL